MADYRNGATATRRLAFRDVYRLVFAPSAFLLVLSDFTYGMARVWTWITSGGHSLGVVPISTNPTVTGDRRAVIDFMVPSSNATATVADVVAKLNSVSHLVTVESVTLVSTQSAVGANAPAERQAATNAASAASDKTLGEQLTSVIDRIGTGATIALACVAGYLAWQILKTVRR